VSKFHKTTLAAVGLTFALTGAACAGQIHTGGATGAYNGDFCPPLSTELGKAKFSYKCSPSRGSTDNLAKVKQAPQDMGFSQFDVFALSVAKERPQTPFHLIRSDLVRECLFMVTRDKTLANYGDIAARASELKFVLPPVGSGSASTFDFLQEIDPDGLGLASNISHADSTDAALKSALEADSNTVTLFVQFPDPSNERFKLINDSKGFFVPVIDRQILRQQVDEQKIYFAQETEVSNPKFWKKGKKVVTACTPMVLFTGNPDNMSGDKRLDHKDLISTVNSLSTEQLLPKQGFFAKYWKKTKAMSASAVAKTIEASEKAREKAAPMLEKAKEKAKELKDKTVEKARDLGEKAAPMLETAKEKARELGEKAVEKAKELGEKAKDKMAQ